MRAKTRYQGSTRRLRGSALTCDQMKLLVDPLAFPSISHPSRP